MAVEKVKSARNLPHLTLHVHTDLKITHGMAGLQIPATRTVSTSVVNHSSSVVQTLSMRLKLEHGEAEKREHEESGWSVSKVRGNACQKVAAISHSDIRPYQCKECNFSFKTKGNWTKHLNSKTHRRRLMQGKHINAFHFLVCLLVFSSSDDEADEHLPLPQESFANAYRKFGQEIILFERTAHTPPSRWMLVDGKMDIRWPDAERVRNCSSAPPSAAIWS
ncbi:unnamed protein product [Haemonchus placei]|uniref:Fumarylacetoacetase n=1 Tax=Haemonchus placei TaxID=6290 RepID=A0A0N4VTU8_HAEPC|nr:unnamed protein product [Haemonchus placei]